MGGWWGSEGGLGGGHPRKESHSCRLTLSFLNSLLNSDIIHGG